MAGVIADALLRGLQGMVFVVEFAFHRIRVTVLVDIVQPVVFFCQSRLRGRVAGGAGDFQLVLVMGVISSVAHDFISGVTVDAGHALCMMDVCGKFKVEPVAGQLL